MIYDGENPVRDFIPCKSPSGEIGFYDIVTAEFYGNAGSGVFTAGPEVGDDPEPDPSPDPSKDPYLWYEDDVPTESTMAQYLDNLSKLRDTLTLPAEPPASPEALAGRPLAEANRIEEILSVIHSYLEAMITVFRRCGAAICGGPGFYFVN